MSILDSFRKKEESTLKEPITILGTFDLDDNGVCKGGRFKTFLPKGVTVQTNTNNLQIKLSGNDNQNRMLSIDTLFNSILTSLSTHSKYFKSNMNKQYIGWVSQPQNEQYRITIKVAEGTPINSNEIRDYVENLLKPIMNNPEILVEEISENANYLDISPDKSSWNLFSDKIFTKCLSNGKLFVRFDIALKDFDEGKIKHYCSAFLNIIDKDIANIMKIIGGTHN